MNIPHRNSLDYTNEEFGNIVSPVIERSINKLKSDNGEDGVIQLWLNANVGLNVYRVKDSHLEFLKNALYEAGWNNDVKWHEDERTGGKEVYIALYL